MRRRSPRPFSVALERVRSRIAPPDDLARVQLAWPQIVGQAVADASSPDSLRDGVLRVRCAESVWAQELALMTTDLLARLEEEHSDVMVKEIRFFVGDVTSS